MVVVSWKYFLSWIGKDREEFLAYLQFTQHWYEDNCDPINFVHDAFTWRSTEDYLKWMAIDHRWRNHLIELQYEASKKNQKSADWQNCNSESAV